MIDCRLVLSDVDGTLAYEKSLVSEENRKWIAKLVNEKHIPFALVSGRMRSGIATIASQIPAPVAICAFNGSYVEVDGKPIHQELMDYDLALEVVRISHRHGVECVLFDLDEWYAEKGGRLYDIQASLYGFGGHAVDLEETLGEWKRTRHPLYKCIPKTLDPEKATMLRDVVRKEMGDRISVYNSSPFVIETVKKGVDKANVVRILSDYYHIAPSQVMAFGDYDNDIGMLKASGYGVAMGNGLDAVKQVARFVTDTNTNDGVAKAIRKYLFEE